MSPPTSDIELNTLPRLDWKPEKSADSLQTLYEHVVSEANKAAGWYVARRQTKKRGARITRGAAISLLAVAGVFPILVQMYPEGQIVVQGVVLKMDAGWVAVFVATAGALVVYDKFYGFSAGWTRYILTHQRIARAVKEFELDWHHERLGAKTPIDEKHAQAMIRQARRFMARVNDLVSQETEEWTREFQSALRQIEEAERKAEADLAPKPGVAVVRLKVEDAAALTKGWKATVGALPTRDGQGPSLAFTDVPPGTHKVRVVVKVKGVDHDLEDAVEVPANGKGEVVVKVP